MRLMNRPKALLGYATIVALIFAADLWSKDYVFDLLGVEIHYVGMDQRPVVEAKSIEIVRHWFEFESVLNYGAFSGWFSSLPWLLLLVSGIAVLVTTGMIAFPRQSRGAFVVALGLVAGGALGNLYDRVMIGAVRDFLKVFYVRGDGSELVWPNFNIADSGICVGVGLILLVEAFGAKAETPAPQTTDVA